MAHSRVVIPGEEVGTVEMFEAGEGTYVGTDGRIRSALYGKLLTDPQQLKAFVLPLHRPNKLRPGDVVYGSIYDNKTGLSLVFVEKVEGVDRALAQDNFAAIHVADVAEHYVEELSREFHPSDLVRAKVVQVDPTLRLSTKAPEFGVVKAWCGQCRRTLELSRRLRGTLYCDNCHRGEPRKISTWYGKAKV
ncbi:MAG TPA: exosome complex RNA-binding protein Csl4 [Candidatus Thermoplasmatota archaeon]